MSDSFWHKSDNLMVSVQRGFLFFFFPQYLLVKSLGEKKNSDLLLDSCRSQQMSEWLVGWFILETRP